MDNENLEFNILARVRNFVDTTKKADIVEEFEGDWTDWVTLETLKDKRRLEVTSSKTSGLWELDHLLPELEGTRGYDLVGTWCDEDGYKLFDLIDRFIKGKL